MQPFSSAEVLAQKRNVTKLNTGGDGTVVAIQNAGGHHVAVKYIPKEHRRAQRSAMSAVSRSSAVVVWLLFVVVLLARLLLRFSAKNCCWVDLQAGKTCQVSYNTVTRQLNVFCVGQIHFVAVLLGCDAVLMGQVKTRESCSCRCACRIHQTHNKAHEACMEARPFQVCSYADWTTPTPTSSTHTACCEAHQAACTSCRSELCAICTMLLVRAGVE